MPHPGLLHPEPLSLQGCTVGPQETLSPTVFTGDTQTQFCLSLCGVYGSCGAQGFFEPSEHLWQVRGSILNTISPHLPSCWGSSALGRGVSPQSHSSAAQPPLQCRATQTKPCVHQEGAVTPQKTDPNLPVRAQESPVEAWVSSGLLQG